MEGVIARRVIPSDNSCLFNAVGYVMDHDKHKAPELRQVIAATVASDPRKYNDAFLGKSNDDYCAWILNPEKWGGAIELSILSEYYGREIAAYDIQTTRCDLYGQEKKYQERVMLIYDGLHYDALAMSPFEGAPEEFDQTIFTVNNNRSVGITEGLALNLVQEAHRKRSYTNTANFTLRCGVCQIGVVGQKEAVEHAQATGHVNFQEYSDGGYINAIMTFPPNYPNCPPTVRFTSEMWHPNVYPVGRVCISILHPPREGPNVYELASERWTPVHTIANQSPRDCYEKFCEIYNSSFAWDKWKRLRIPLYNCPV